MWLPYVITGMVLVLLVVKELSVGLDEVQIKKLNKVLYPALVPLLAAFFIMVLIQVMEILKSR